MTITEAIAKADRLASHGAGTQYVFDNGHEAWVSSTSTRSLWRDLEPVHVAKQPMQAVEYAALVRRRADLYEQLAILLGRLAGASGAQISCYADSIHTTRSQIAFVEDRLGVAVEVREP